MVGVDVTRYFFQMRKPDAHLLFDLDVALDHSDKNPVYKVQYAHARMCSIFAKAGLEPESGGRPSADLELLAHELERELIKLLSDFPASGSSGRRRSGTAPHVVCDYLEQTAGAGELVVPCRKPDPEPRARRPGRRRAVRAWPGWRWPAPSRSCSRNGLDICSVSTRPGRMDRDDDLLDSNEEAD